MCSTNYVDIVSGNISPDHVHMLISVPPSQSLDLLRSSFALEILRKEELFF
ncbi:MAG: transposase [Holosporaceae bacterium]|nr:transposase [Holosporaceae bacterium]